MTPMEGVKMNLTEAEKQFLMAIRSIDRHPNDWNTGENLNPNLEALRNRAKLIFLAKLNEASFEKITIEKLIEKDLVKENDGLFSLTSSGLTLTRQVAKEFIAETYSNTLVRLTESKIASNERKRIYGKDLYQFNMLTMNQLAKLLEVLNLSPASSLLDLGCGLGKIAEYISDQTQTSVLGIDIAYGAIDVALKRTQKKRNRINFRVEDMDELSLPQLRFDCIIAIDTLYYVEDLEITVDKMKRILKPKGQMGIFYSQVCSPSESMDILLSHNTKLAEVLKKLNLQYQTYEFTEEEKEFWNQRKKGLEEFKSNYEAEGILDLYEIGYQEAVNLVKTFNEGRCRRYFYHVIT